MLALVNSLSDPSAWHPDWITATIMDRPTTAFERLASHYPEASIERRRGVNHYEFRDEVTIDGEVQFYLCHGGQNPLPNVTSTSFAARKFRPILQAEYPQHRPSRIDVARDWEEPEAAAKIVSKVKAWKAENAPRLSHQFIGDPDDPDQGRTWTWGARSGHHFQAYEKGKQLREELKRAGCRLHPNWVRTEMRIRPEAAPRRIRDTGYVDARDIAASMTETQLFTLANWGPSLLALFGTIEVASLERMPDLLTPLDRKMAIMVEQWGRTTLGYMDLNGMNAEQWGRYFVRMAVEQEERRDRGRH